MALSEDQRALLQLLLAGDGYEQVAGVLGTDAADVRARAHAALRALEDDRGEELSAPAVRDRLEALDRPQVATSPVPVSASRLPGEPSGAGRGARWAIAAVVGIAALTVVVVLLVTGSSGDGGGESAPGTTADREDVVSIPMRPVGGSTAEGTIAVVRVADQPAIDLAIRGLAPSGRGESYVLWFVGSGGRSLPVAFQAVGDDGRLTGRTPIPSAAVGLLPSFDTAELTLTRRRGAASAVQQAAQSGTLPQPVGTTVLRGSLR